MYTCTFAPSSPAFAAPPCVFDAPDSRQPFVLSLHLSYDFSLRSSAVYLSLSMMLLMKLHTRYFESKILPLCGSCLVEQHLSLSGASSPGTSKLPEGTLERVIVGKKTHVSPNLSSIALGIGSPLSSSYFEHEASCIRRQSSSLVWRIGSTSESYLPWETLHQRLMNYLLHFRE